MRRLGLLLTLFAGAALAEGAPTYDIGPDDIEGELLRPMAVERWAIDEATTGLLVEDHRAPLVELRLQLPAGRYSPWFEANHVEEAWMTSLYDEEGALRARADALAADFAFDVRDTASTLTVSCLKRDLPEVLVLLRDVLGNGSTDADELKRLQQSTKIGWEGQVKDPQFRATQAAAFALFAEGDPRRRSYEEPDAIHRKAADLAAARAALQRLPGRALGFAGDLTPDEARAAAAGLLPPAEAAPAELAPVYLPLLDPPGELAEPMPNLTQVYFGYLREGITYDDPDYAAWLVADHVLGGHFFSRLYVALRHEGGETYGAFTAGGPAEQPEIYALSTFTRAENRAVTEQKLRDTLATFHAGGITEDELADAVGYLQGARLFDRQSPGQALGEAMFELRYGLEPGFEQARIDAAAALSVEDVNAFIARFFDPAQYTMLTVQPKD